MGGSLEAKRGDGWTGDRVHKPSFRGGHKYSDDLRVVWVREVSAVPHIPRGDVADDFGSDNGVLPEQREDTADTAVDGKVECKRVRRSVRLQFRELLHEGIQKNIRKMPVGRNE